MDFFQYATTPTTIAIMLGVVLIVCLTLYGKLRPIYIDAAKRIAREIRLRDEVTKQGEAIEDLVKLLLNLQGELKAVRSHLAKLQVESAKSHANILERLVRMEGAVEVSTPRPRVRKKK